MAVSGRRLAEVYPSGRLANSCVFGSAAKCLPVPRLGQAWTATANVSINRPTDP